VASLLGGRVFWNLAKNLIRVMFSAIRCTIFARLIAKKNGGSGLARSGRVVPGHR
jgi:hypothetical protein